MGLQTDFMVAVNQIAAERNIDPDDVLDAIKLAIQTGFRRDYPEEEVESVIVDIDKSNGMISVFADKKVVDLVTNSDSQIALEDALKIEPKLKVGDHIQVDITPSGDFGRVAAQAAKQVILQKIRESEKNAVMAEFTGHIGEIEYAVVQRMDGDNVIFEIRRATAIMPQEDRIPSEFYKSGSRLKVLLKDIRETSRGKQLIVSRADPMFLEALFKLEVPEIVSGSVEIKSIAREAGSRSKVAVSSNVEGVDPIGSCVGQKGVRINAIMNELKFGNHEEKIDIIAYAEDTSEFIANALSPAQVIRVTIKDDKKKDALVIVPDEQLSLAIGRDGQNVRLAAKLTSWNIDIQGETVKVNDNQLDEEQRQKLADARRAKLAPTEEEVKEDEKGKEETEENVEIEKLKNEEASEKEEEIKEKPVKEKKTKKKVKD
ncbi:transcription termination/antitermination protein NusA [Candidatus Dojkabacteria bacterium]|jgi:N utilization substance protein A|uniref:Transcription termination/antitermination protein NusA n=1 Tax=Candidatus Dojkabacteria bacterium TaxID=2099670 RepID=A0A955I7H0_9BACT|nr:transcription termination/antitermination protein NusA [Candidatus Dojkabacteria bacterium]